MKQNIYLLAAICLWMLGQNVFCPEQLNAQVKIGGTGMPVAGAILDLTTDSKWGLLLPQMTANPLSGESGMIIYNTTVDSIYFYNGTRWVSGNALYVDTADVAIGKLSIIGLVIKTDEGLETVDVTYDGSDSVKVDISIPLVTPTSDGLMSAADKAKLAHTIISLGSGDVPTGKFVISNSGKAYLVDSYPNITAINNLRWTVQNLQEGVAYTTRYPGHLVGERGYYYRWPQAAGVATPAEYDPQYDLCRTSLGAGWRLPKSIEWRALIDRFNTEDLTDQQRSYWNTAPASLAGYQETGQGQWASWNESGHWWSSTESDLFPLDHEYQSLFSLFIFFANGTMTEFCSNIETIPVRCVQE